MLERGGFGESGRRFNPETKPEIGELKAGFANIVRNGTKEELARLLREYPPRDSNGELVWLLTSGMAVELATLKPREHHDLDLVIMNPNSSDEWEHLGTDNVSPGSYWADMTFEPDYLAKTARKFAFTQDNTRYEVECVHPVIIMTQKLSDAFGRDPRKRDVADAAAVLEVWKSHEGRSSSGISIVNHAIEALPYQQQAVTIKRIEILTSLVAPLRLSKI